MADPTLRRRARMLAGVLVLAAAVGGGVFLAVGPVSGPSPAPLKYKPRKFLDTAGYATVVSMLRPWPPKATVAEIADAYRGAGFRNLERVEREMAAEADPSRMASHMTRAALLNYEGEPVRAYDVLAGARAEAEADPHLAAEWLYTVIYYQGLTALRRGETDNCILCR